MTLVCLSLAWTAGILLGAAADFPPALLLLSLSLLPLPFLLRRHRRAAVTIALAALVLAAGVLRYRVAEVPAGLRQYNDRGEVALRGVVSADPEEGARTVQLRLAVSQVEVGGQWQPAGGTVLVFAPSYSRYQYGDRLLVRGELATPPPLAGFDYAAYLAHEGIYSTMLYPEVQLTGRGSGSAFLAWLYRVRRHLADSISRLLPEPQASLVNGVLLGKRGTIPDDLRDSFTRSGTAHLLAISGLHLGIITGLMLLAGVRLLGRRYQAHVWLALGTAWLYALLTGLDPPVLRAAIMASMFLAAELLGRQRRGLPALAFAAAVMVGLEPAVLWQASFQLSFLAVAGLVLVSPWLQAGVRLGLAKDFGEDSRLASRLGGPADALALTLGVLVAVWPLVAYYFGIISLVAPLATLLALPALPGIIVSGGLAAGLGLLWLPLGWVTGWVAWLLASYTTAVVTGLASLPGAAIEPGAVDGRPVWGYYAALGAVLLLLWRRPALLPGALPRITTWASRVPLRLVLPVLVVTASLATIAAATMPDGRLHVAFLDVGQGDAIYIRTPAHQDILVDGGPDAVSAVRGLGREMPFWDRTIDLVVLTHPHADHLTGLMEVVQRYRVRQVLLPAGEWESPPYDEWLRRLAEQGIEVTTAVSGQRIDGGAGVVIEVMVPGLADAGTEDDRATVLRVSAGEVGFLLTSDISSQAERWLLLARAPLQSTVLKVGHHGSATSSATFFLAVVQPRAAVISVGADNPFGHPDEDVLARLEAAVGREHLFRTDRHGTVEFTTDGRRLWVRTER